MFDNYNEWTTEDLESLAEEILAILKERNAEKETDDE
tara:strand:- start:269 stop:379 length:111 start_codon:yes stop_codon:yes gene_type:complete